MNEEVTSLTPQQANFAIRQIITWMNTCDDNDRRSRAVDLDHSSLAYRLLTGCQLLEHPPPLRFSYPAYEMVEKDEIQIREFNERGYVVYDNKTETIVNFDESKYNELIHSPVISIDQHCAYIWEDKENKIIRHVKTGLRYEYFEKTAYPVWVAADLGKPEDHPYMGKFLRRLPFRFSLETEKEQIKTFGIIEHVVRYIKDSRYEEPKVKNYLLRDNITKEWLAKTKEDWRDKFGVIFNEDGTVNKDWVYDRN